MRNWFLAAKLCCNKTVGMTLAVCWIMTFSKALVNATYYHKKSFSLTRFKQGKENHSCDKKKGLQLVVSLSFSPLNAATNHRLADLNPENSIQIRLKIGKIDSIIVYRRISWWSKSWMPFADSLTHKQLQQLVPKNSMTLIYPDDITIWKERNQSNSRNRNSRVYLHNSVFCCASTNTLEKE